MIFVAGSANLDFVVRAPHIPARGETVLGRDFKTFPGGKGANQAVASARAGGVPTEMLLAVGGDPYANVIESSLQAAGVRMHTLRAAHQPTGCAFICVSDDAENAITVAPGANSSLQPQHLPSLSGVSHLLMQLEIPLETVQDYAQQARKQGVRVVLNAAPAQALPAQLLALVDVLIVNEDELTALTGSHATIAQQLARLPTPCVVVTLGARGSLMRMGATLLTQPGHAVEALDTTAAGDTFCGVLTASLSQGLGIQDALMRASAASALACTRLGAQESIPTHEEVEVFLRNAKSPTDHGHAALLQYCGACE
jgi:ribokinase